MTCAPRYFKGQKLEWPMGPSKSSPVTIVDGPFRNFERWCPSLRWEPWANHAEAIYLCTRPDGTPLLLAQHVLSDGWSPCAGEHRLRADGTWERLEAAS